MLDQIWKFLLFAFLRFFHFLLSWVFLNQMYFLSHKKYKSSIGYDRISKIIQCSYSLVERILIENFENHHNNTINTMFHVKFFEETSNSIRVSWKSKNHWQKISEMIYLHLPKSQVFPSHLLHSSSLLDSIIKRKL